MVNGVYQFTNDSPFCTDTEGLMWLGYEMVGENYEPGYFYHKDADRIGSSHHLAVFMGEGNVVLDIGAGLGASSISFALAGLKVISADISQVMLESAVKRAEKHSIPHGQITFARMNGYALALADNSVDAVLEVDMLHQVNHLELVIAEILRVLKPGGYFLQYGAWETPLPYTEEQLAINAKYNEALKDIQDYYNEALAKTGYNGGLFSSWEQAAECKAQHFELVTTLGDTGCYDVKNVVWTLDMGLHKTKTRAAGAKQLIPEAVHDAVWAEMDAYAKGKYGSDYGSMRRYNTNRSGMVVYKRR
jgi:ubiquinone/menaquinone biosynthesis C-methylase UbiE